MPKHDYIYRNKAWIGQIYDSEYTTYSECIRKEFVLFGVRSEKCGDGGRFKVVVVVVVVFYFI